MHAFLPLTCRSSHSPFIEAADGEKVEAKDIRTNTRLREREREKERVAKIAQTLARVQQAMGKNKFYCQSFLHTLEYPLA